jgi:hypothetical protein
MFFKNTYGQYWSKNFGDLEWDSADARRFGNTWLINRAKIVPIADRNRLAWQIIKRSVVKILDIAMALLLISSFFADLFQNSSYNYFLYQISSSISDNFLLRLAVFLLLFFVVLPKFVRIKPQSSCPNQMWDVQNDVEIALKEARYTETSSRFAQNMPLPTTRQLHRRFDAAYEFRVFQEEAEQIIRVAARENSRFGDWVRVCGFHVNHYGNPLKGMQGTVQAWFGRRRTGRIANENKALFEDGACLLYSFGFSGDVVISLYPAKSDGQQPTQTSGGFQEAAFAKYIRVGAAYLPKALIS